MTKSSELKELEERVDRIEKALRTLGWWLVQAQTGFGHHDASALEKLLDPPKKEAVNE